MKSWQPAFLACLILIPPIGDAATPMVAAAYRHTIALKDDGTIAAVGNDTYGQLGLGRALRSPTPLQVGGLSRVIAVSNAGSASLALRADGTVWGWGDNLQFQLGDGTTTSRSIPAPIAGLDDVIALSPSGSYAIKRDGSIWAWGWHDPGSHHAGADADTLQRQEHPPGTRAEK